MRGAAFTLSLFLAAAGHGQCIPEKVFPPANSGHAESVGIWGDRAAVGAHYWLGSTYLYRRAGDGWIEEAQVFPSDGQILDQFGYRVALHGQTLLVGAYLHSPFGVLAAGAAYVFEHDGAEWVQTHKLIASDAAPNLHFGRAVALSGEFAVMGAPNKPQRVYIFRREGSDWVEEAILPSPDKGEWYGSALAISGDTLVVGDHAHALVGRAYVFRRIGGEWLLEATLTPPVPNTNGRFGRSVAIDGDTIVIGEPTDLAAGKGEAHIFERAGGAWELTQTIQNWLPSGIWYGYSVGTHAGRVVVGGPFNPTGIPCSGSADVFLKENGVWKLKVALTSVRNGKGCALGWSVAVHGNRVIAGAPQDTFPGSLVGSAFIFDDVFDCWCYADCDNSGGWGQLSIDDFICFQLKFALGDPYANCDGNTNPDGSPILDIDDFLCFQLKFALGELCF